VFSPKSGWFLTVHGMLQDSLHRSPLVTVLWTRTGTAGTVTFCLSGTRTGFESGSNIKCKSKKKIENERPTFREIMLILTLKRQDFVQIFCFWKIVLNTVWIRNQSGNQNFFKVGTGTGNGTATNHYGSTTKLLSTPKYCAPNESPASMTGISLLFLYKTSSFTKSE
jgi:hypothetical protein